jgi:uncharacterized protein
VEATIDVDGGASARLSTQAPSLYILPGIAIGVTGSAFLMTAVTQGKAGIRRLLQRLMWWRLGPRWFAVAVLLIPLSEVLVAVALGSPDALRALTPAALPLYPAAYLSHFFFGPLSKNQAGADSRFHACNTGSVPFGEACCLACSGWDGTSSCTCRAGSR